MVVNANYTQTLLHIIIIIGFNMSVNGCEDDNWLSLKS